MPQSFCLQVVGDYACFTRPEMKVELVSYDVITPSAARALFEAILWKPAIRWRIRRIEVLQPHPLDQLAPQRGWGSRFHQQCAAGHERRHRRSRALC